MPSLSLKGVTVNFPFPPYGCQVDYMNKVIECLQKKENGVLESPTGTGKTLCLLCATLAWREYFKDTISARKVAERLGGEEMFPKTPLSSWGTAATDGDTPTYYSDVPKIIYASRTHSQLAQVINELKNTSYRPKVCVLGSREQLCINQEVMRQESNHVKVHMCRAKVSTRSCVFYNNVEERSTDRDLADNILDVEDLVKFGNKQRVCPYYLSRSLKQQADVVFMPYNYLLDPKSRRAHNIELNGAVVIFDEAHNVVRLCVITPAEISKLPFKDTQILLNLEAAVDSYEVPSEKGITKPGIFIYELLERAHLTYNSKTEVYEALEQILGHLTGQQGVFLNTTGLQKLANIIQLVFCGEPSDKERQQQMERNTAYFKVHIHRDNSYHKKPSGADAWAATSTKKQGNILSYWCFSPGFSMQDLENQGVRCIILTSGTLSPLSSFTSEMRIKFPVSLENSHVIERDQIFVGVIDRGPDGVHLSSAFDRRFLPENMASLGSTVANLSRVVPDGLLVFFPSFPLMEKTLDFWRANGHADRIENVKPMFVEPKGKGNFNEVIDGYYNKVNDPASKGGTFFAVCRGKASEGLDFADSFGRGVIITGLPFPPRMDPRVVLKMQFLDEMSRKKTPGAKEAFRFTSSNARAQLPSWVRPYVRLYASFGNVIRDVSQFFRVAQKMTGGTEDRCYLLDSHSGVIVLSAMVPSVQGVQQVGRSLLALLQLTLVLHTDPGHPIGSGVLAGKVGVQRLGLLGVGASGGGGAGCGPRGLERKPGVSGTVSGRGTASRVKDFLAEMKTSLSQISFDRIIKALQTYKKTDNLDVLLTETAALTQDANTHSLLRGLYQFIRPHHKRSFDEKCQQLTGKGCGYKPDHSLSADEKKALMLQSAAASHPVGGPGSSSQPGGGPGSSSQPGGGPGSSSQLNTQQLNKGGRHLNQHAAASHPAGGPGSSSCTPACSQLNTQQLNKGGHHLNQQGQTQPHSGSGPTRDVPAAFLADVKKAVGAEKSAQLFQVIQSYKKTDNYDNLVATVVSLFTERDEDFNLLVRFGMFIPARHKKQYQDMLDALIGNSVSVVPAETEDQQRPATSSPKAQSKISSFFSNNQRK
ncbi:regulator of telomere elongation helicase 1 [Etheostoma cragini]|uniref:regulator of telomere elongation helicase 1 n=1 Tax=Etheostoma cragini TaxID=417921 RepID=UPI00155ED2A4|nr:regulator of telomere elongation helicase 1 [Etheostoma cragini]